MPYPSKDGKSKKKGMWDKKKVNKTKIVDDKIADLHEKYKNIDSKNIKTFSDLPLSEETKKGLAECEYEVPTEIQKETLTLGLRGLDILGAAKTGSGKTLAFLIPLIEKLYTLKWTPTDGLGALVITPTRELAYQIFETLKKIGKYHDFSAGLVIGGKDLKYETDRLSNCNIIICTPGRILHHMDENQNFDPVTTKLLVLDEADRCLDMGFEKTMNAILDNLPTEDRQTLLFSATQTRSVKDLARLSLVKPVFVSVHEHSDKATPDKLAQTYIVCELHDKINMLWSFLKSHKKKKLLVFMQSCKQVKYVSELFKRLKCNMTLLALHGKLHQLRRMAIYDEFCQTESAVVLIATDVAARGLDFPSVDWVIQSDCPEDAKTYLHRVGRTARHSAVGQSLLTLLPSEKEGMLKQLRIQRIPIDEIHVAPKKIVDVQRKTEAHLASDSELKASAQRAFLAYIKSAFLLKNKEIFDVSKLDTDKFAHSLGLAVPPRIRFLQRQQKSKKKASKEEKDLEIDQKDLESSQKPFESSQKDFESGQKSIMESSDEEDDMLTIKRKDHEIQDEDDVTDEPLEIGENKGGKVVTKASIAKKILKKNIQANQKTLFDEEGQATIDGLSQKKSQEGQDYDQDREDGGGGIDLVKAKKVLKAEDKFDKELKKEQKKTQKRLLKEAKHSNDKRNAGAAKLAGDDSDSSGEESDNLDWLPDPDKIYGKDETTTENEELHKQQEINESSLNRPKKKKAKLDTEKANLEDLALKLLTG